MSHVRGTSGVMLKQALSRAFDREGTRFLAVRAEYESRPGPASTMHKMNSSGLVLTALGQPRSAVFDEYTNVIIIVLHSSH